MKTKKIGEIFVEKGLLSDKTVERVVSRSQKVNKKIGAILVESEIITHDELSEALAVQFNLKYINDISKFSYPPEVLNLIPIDFAMQHLVFPLKLTGKQLAVAIADPSECKFIKNFAINNSFDLDIYVATRQDILNAISKYYIGNDISETKKVTILIVEDSANERSALSAIVAKQGYRCIEAADGLDGFKMALLENPKVIISDKVMPKLDGYRMLEALKNIEETAKIPVILITGSISSTEEAVAFDKGFFDFIKKPYDEMSVVTRVKRALQFSLK
jgi:CheY-like chemotaxis protein